MQRVLIIGSCGAGKSTLARRLAAILDIEIVHLDALYWKPGWVESASAEWECKLQAALDKESWIMDGNYSRTLPQRLEACDTVIFVDLPRLVCVWRILKRILRHHGRTRPDMPEGCPERFDLEFLLWTWNYPNRSRPHVLALLDFFRDSKRVVHLSGSRAVDRFVAQQLASETVT